MGIIFPSVFLINGDFSISVYAIHKIGLQTKSTFGAPFFGKVQAMIAEKRLKERNKQTNKQTNKETQKERKKNKIK